MKLYNKRDSQKDRCAWIEGHPVSRPETEIVQASVVNNFSIGIRVGDLHVIGHGLGLLRGLFLRGACCVTGQTRQVELGLVVVRPCHARSLPAATDRSVGAGWPITTVPG